MMKTDLTQRVITQPYYLSWKYPDGNGEIRENGKLKYDGLNDHEKMMLYVYAWNISDICPTKKTVMKEFGWSSYKVAKMFRELKAKGMECVALTDEYTGLLCGRGYFLDLEQLTSTAPNN